MSSENMDSRTFEAIADLAYRESGLQLVAEKSSMIQSRLRHRLKALGINNFGAYADFVVTENGSDERRQMISALTTNVSHFFREKHHFDALAKTILPRVFDGLTKGSRFRLWSAGCSNGQEAYSIAMTLLECAPELRSHDVKILATDIDPNVVSFAQKGIYPERMVAGIPEPLLSKYFTQTTDTTNTDFCVNDNLKSLVVFKELNLLSDWPIKQNIDVIFCRNVVIYFDTSTQNKLWQRFNEVLSADGVLFLGHSERIATPDAFGFQSVGPTTYTHKAASI
ncbi:MAG: protein-glutamate O-methyltransferase [Pseudomonadota bacterium]